ncbi:50S ribosomal protein L33 [Alkalihalobacillus sp. AL-G]|nr:50S ribosomal protein L33 [Alkalihalobacillus sp. AL-G]WLD93512.1 50S ribosomal protein L33 [Alkalihalobacillus sp. AL-G]
MRVKVILACEICKQRNYTTMKNKTTEQNRVERKKFCKQCQTHTLHRETK